MHKQKVDGHYGGVTLWALRWRDVMDITVPRRYGHYGGVTLWTLRWRDVMDSTVARRYGHYSGATSWTLRWRDVMKITVAQRFRTHRLHKQKAEKRLRPQRVNVLGHIGCINKRQRKDNAHNELTF